MRTALKVAGVFVGVFLGMLARAIDRVACSLVRVK